MDGRERQPRWAQEDWKQSSSGGKWSTKQYGKCHAEALGSEMGMLERSSMDLQIGLKFAGCVALYNNVDVHNTGAIGHFADRFAAEHIDSCPFSLTSEASQVGFAPWFVSALLYCCLCKISEQ